MAAIALIAWGIGQRSSGDELWQAELDSRFAIETLAAAENPPPRAFHAQRVADHLGNDIFPPDLAGALSSLAYALRVDPMDSATWTRLARVRLLQGRDDEARAALEFSDRLDPMFPRQRLQAVRLWFLLGDEARARDTAERIAALGGMYREQAAGELVASGVEATEVFAAFGGPDLPAGELLPLLRRLNESTPDREALWAMVPDSAFQDASFRRESMRMLMRPAQPDMLLAVWKRLIGEGDQDDGLVLDNASLGRAPRWDGFPLGWQRIQDVNGHGIRWVAPSAATAGGGHLELEISRFGEPRMNWLAYRAVLPADGAARVRVPIRHREMNGARARLMVVVEGDQHRSDWSNGLRDSWQDLAVSIAPRGRSAVVDVYVEWQVQAEGIRRQPDGLLVGGLDMRMLRQSEAAQ